jgi:SnoaL-like domain
MATDFVALMKRNLFEFFGNRDGESRRTAIKALFAEDCIFSDPHGRQVGHEALDRAIAALHDATPGFVFSEGGTAQALSDSGRVRWGYGPAAEAPAITGEDLVVFRDGKITEIYTFLDQPDANGRRA